MTVPLEWLKDYTNIIWSPEELAHRLTMAGIAVEGVEGSGNEAVLELDLTPNRGDCLGLINLAREVAALSGEPVKLPEVLIKESSDHIDNYIKIEIASPDLCRRYAARLVKNCRVAPSPDWMQERLVKAGIRPINNIVDTTNYVMLETNQPLHAFDYHLLGPEKRILVRTADPDEFITTLDGVTRKLDQEMLLITEGERAVALAGVMGGENTEINEETRDVLLESAWFLGTNIRKTSKKLALRSDSSMRFEKGTDIEGVVFAVNRAAQLLQDLAGGEVVAGLADNYPSPYSARIIALRPARASALLGEELDLGDISDCFKNLGLSYQVENGCFMVEAPSYRPDLMIEADLIEEVARLYGYDNIPFKLPEGAAHPGGLDSRQKFRRQVRDLMARNFFEVVNYSFINPTAFDRIGLPSESALRQVIRLANPLSEDQSVMRTTLLPGLLSNISVNLARQNQNLAFFELGAVFLSDPPGLPDEPLKLGAVVCGERQSYWLKNNTAMDFFFLKGILEDLLQQLGVETCRFSVINDPSYHPGRAAALELEDRTLGIIGEIHPLVLENYNIRQRVCAMEIDMGGIYDLVQKKNMNEEIVRYPSVERDIALLVPAETQAYDLMECIKETGGETLRQVYLFDLYAGDQVPSGLKSMAYRLIWQSSEKTLTDAEVSPLMEQIVSQLKKNYSASLR